MTTLRGHVIDLVARPRWGRACIEMLRKLGVAASLFPAVDGPGGDVTDLVVLADDFAKNYKGRPPTPGEIGCFATYREIAKKALSGQLAPVADTLPDWWLVFEDDAVAYGDMSASLISEIIDSSELQGFDYVVLHLGVGRYRHSSPVTKVTAKHRRECRSHAQIMHRRVMEIILRWDMRHPIDTALTLSKDVRFGVLWGKSHFTYRTPTGVEAITWARRKAEADAKAANEQPSTPVDPTSLGLSVVMVCSNRNDHLSASFNSWRRHPAVREFIIVDWASTIPVSELKEVRELRGPEVKILRMDSPAMFNIGQAFNIGLKAATMPIVAKVDCDVVLRDGSQLTDLLAELASGKSELLRMPNTVGVYGTFILMRDAFAEVGFLREDLHGYGWEDAEFLGRLKSKKVRVLPANQAVVWHVPHDDDRRVTADGRMWLSKDAAWKRNEARAALPPVLPHKTYTVVSDSGGVATMTMDGLTRCGPLMDPTHWDGLFSRYAGMTTNPVSVAKGNTGDQMIWTAMSQFYDRHGISTAADGWDVILWPGGGNMGTLYAKMGDARTALARTAKANNLPFVVLPQTWNAPDTTTPDGARLTVRDPDSLRFAGESAEFFHDMALGLCMDVHLPPRTEKEGFFFRSDKEAFKKVPGSKDPAAYTMTAADYLSLAALYETVHTDRLHFAIACLMVGTRVILYPNNYHKNRSIFESSLQALGCEFAEETP